MTGARVRHPNLAALVAVLMVGGTAAHADAPTATPAPLAPTAAASAAPAAPDVVAPADTDERMDRGLARLHSKDYDGAAGILYQVHQHLPAGDARRDLASYHLATALLELGFTQGAIEHYVEVISGRRAPELIDKSLAALQPLEARGLVQRERFIEGVLYSGQYTELSPDVADFVEYLQALTDIRRGFAKWGTARLAVLARNGRSYSFSARYALAVERLNVHEDDAAASEFRAIAASPASVPAEIRNRARIALARILYERKQYDDAWRIYSQVDLPLPMQDVVLIERAWDRVAGGDQQRALGMLIGLGAPVFRNIFAPERNLIRGIALRRLCQYRAAHVAVRDFRTTYGDLLAKIKGRTSLKDDPTIRRWAVTGTQALREKSTVYDALTSEKPTIRRIGEKSLRDHLDAVYDTGIASVGNAIDRDIDSATEAVAEELLRIDEQMSVLDYEIGAGLFKASGEGKNTGKPPSVDVPYISQSAYFKFDGEYWSDELGNYTVLEDDRCVR